VLRRHVPAALVAITGRVYAASGNEDIPSAETHGKWNGRQWNSLGALEQVAYLRGIIEGTEFLRALLEKLESGNRWALNELKEAGDMISPAATNGKLFYEEICEQITRVYSNPANVIIPIVYIKSIAEKLLIGASQDEIEKQLERQRRIWLG
jgi:hypothetical protein